MKQIESLGYQVGIGDFEGTWYATAQDDKVGQFHRAILKSEDDAVAALAESVGIELTEC